MERENKRFIHFFYCAAPRSTPAHAQTIGAGLYASSHPMRTCYTNPFGRLSAAIPGRVGTCCLVLFLLLSLLACSSNNNKPEGVLSKDEMAKAMIEYYLKEARINLYNLQQDSALALLKYYREEYADDKITTDSVLEKSYQYYLDNPMEFSEVYDRIIDSLALQEQRARAKE